MRLTKFAPVVIGVSCMIALGAVLLSGARKPLFDEYEVVGVSRDGAFGRYAVTYQLNGARAPTDFRVTIITASQRQVGSFGFLPGQTAVTWRGMQAAMPRWVDGQLSFVVPAETSRQRGGFALCAPDNAAPPPVVCFDPAVVRIITIN
jgi:hypothetical protein